MACCWSKSNFYTKCVVIFVALFRLNKATFGHFSSNEFSSHIRPTPTFVSTGNNKTATFDGNHQSTLLRTRRQAQSSCTFNYCCSRLNGCQPGDCYLNEGTCTALRNAGALANLGRVAIGGMALALYRYQVGNIYGVHADNNPTRNLKGGLSDETTYMYSKFGTLSIWSDTAGPTQTIIASNEPHLATNDALTETINEKTTVIHSPIWPDNEKLYEWLQCGPITVMELVDSQTVWSTITPTSTTTTTANDCTKRAGQNVYDYAINFHTQPPGGQNFHNQRPYPNFFNQGQQGFHRRNSFGPCYWCTGAWQQTPSSWNAWPTTNAIGWSDTPNGLYSGASSGFGWFSDVQADQVKDDRSACLTFIEHYAESPLNSSQLLDFVNKTFYSTDELRTKYAKGVEPSTFHCCHVEFADKFFPNNKQTFVQPVLPKDVTCRTLVDALYEKISGKNQKKKIVSSS